MITRLAPTPSGYLHLGNAVNFQLVAWLAEREGGDIALRIDDTDAPRYRSAYVDDIFAVVDWMDIRVANGPRSRAEFETGFSMGLHRDRYRAAVDRAQDDGLELYACRCSRGTARIVPTGGCVSGCRAAGFPHEPGVSALRVHVPPGTGVRIGSDLVRLDEAMGDFVVWRRDDLPSYHLASVLEDELLGTTHVVRGEDLLPSTAAQLFLAPSLGAATFLGATFLHHALVTGDDGRKLSKSRVTVGAPLDRSPQQRRRIHDVAASLGHRLDITPPDQPGAHPQGQTHDRG